MTKCNTNLKILSYIKIINRFFIISHLLLLITNKLVIKILIKIRALIHNLALLILNYYKLKIMIKIRKCKEYIHKIILINSNKLEKFKPIIFKMK